MRSLPLWLGLWLVVAPAVASGANPGAGPSADAETLAGWAKTPEEHRAVAAYFKRKASDARRDANLHHQMELSYEHWLAAQDVVKHCRALVALDRQMAREYEALAAAHEAEAQK